MTTSGDACHPMLPYLAQGANSSLEDGAVLGLLLGHMTDKTQLPQILRLYESLRKSRGEAIVRETFKQVSIFNLNLSEVFEAANHRYRDTTSTWKRVKSRRSATSSSCRNSERRSRATSPADGEFSFYNAPTLSLTISPYRTCPEVQPWIYGYDAMKEVEKAVAENPGLFSQQATSGSSCSVL